MRQKVLLGLWVLWEKNLPTHVSNILFLTDSTDEQNTQHSTETLNQPISQNVTANRKPHPQPLSEWRGEWSPRLPLHVLQMFSSLTPSISRPKGVTSHTNNQLAPPPSPPPKGGAWSPRYPCEVDVCLVLLSYRLSCRGNLTYYAPPCGGGDGGGATILWTRNVGWKVLLNLWVLWEKEIPFVKEGTPPDNSPIFFFSQITQKNRTHSVPQRH